MSYRNRQIRNRTGNQNTGPGWARQLIVLCAVLVSAGAAAKTADGVPDPLLNQYIPDVSLVGAARMRVLLWDVYDARLFAPGGEWRAGRPFALSLDYLRDLKGDAIAARAIEEIRNQGFADEVTLARWFDLMSTIIPDVGPDTELLGIADADQNTLFLRNGKLIGRIDEPAFTRAFFDIWLSEATSAPALRQRLLGEV